MNFNKEQIEFMKNASDHVENLCGGRGYGKTHQLIKEMEDKINKLEKENQQLKKQVTEYQDEIFARDNSWYDMQD